MSLFQLSFYSLPAAASKRNMGTPGAAPSSTMVHKTLYLLCTLLWQWPLGTPSPATWAAWGQSSQEEEARKRKKGVKASHSTKRETALTRSFSTQDSPSVRAAGAETPMSRSQSCCQGNEPHLFPLTGTSGSDSTEKKHIQNTQSLLKYAFCGQCFQIYSRIYALHRSPIFNNPPVSGL